VKIINAGGSIVFLVGVRVSRLNSILLTVAGLSSSNTRSSSMMRGSTSSTEDNDENLVY
jgi:hypothetical protein